MAWTKQQMKLFAKQVKQSGEGSAWWSFVDNIREAVLDAKVMNVVLGNDRIAIEVDDIRSLRTGVAIAMMDLGLATETGRAARAKGGG